VKNARGEFTLSAIAVGAFAFSILILVPHLYAAESSGPSWRTYAVNRKVSDFPTKEDLGTPEAAYATINRAMVAEGDAAFSRLSISEIARTMPSVPKKAMAANEAQEWLGAEILEVDVYGETNAGAFAKVRLGGNEHIDVRWLNRANGRWLNSGNSIVGSLDEARELFSGRCAREEAQMRLTSRPPVANPQTYLHPFVEFLRHEARDPMTFLLQALATHRMVIIGEVHHRSRYWAFNSALARDRTFAERVGVIYLELPGNDQALVEQFLAAPTYDPHPLIEMLRDMQLSGWPDQGELEFFKTVWEVNQREPKDRRLRIVITDNPWPWKEIITSADWQRFDIDRMERNRNQIMTDNILRDLREHADDPRNALFIVGYVHALENPTFSGIEPWKPVGWRLGEKLGRTNVFAVFPHSPVVADQGGVNGRIALGLFETAFASLTNKPIAFPLNYGPFGEQIFDASMDVPTTEPFRHFFQAYLSPAPVENETLSPLIPSFYADDFVKEVDRRFQLWQGKGLRELGVKCLDAASFMEFAEQEEGGWGTLRPEWSAGSLGPPSAWELGSDWKQKMVAAKLKNWQQHKAAIRNDALRLFEAIRHANYEHPGHYLSFPAPDVEYGAATDSSWMRWICRQFCTNPIVGLDLGPMTSSTNSLPTISYRVRLKNDGRLEGVLIMNYNPGRGQWCGVKGLDWQLPPKH
jgi:hypothetical protein